MVIKIEELIIKDLIIYSKCLNLKVSYAQMGWPLAGSGFKEGMDSLKLGT